MPKMLTEISGNGAWGFLDLIRRNGLRDKLATQIGGYFTHAPKHERHLQLFLPPQERMKSNRPVCRRGVNDCRSQRLAKASQVGKPPIVIAL